MGLYERDYYRDGRPLFSLRGPRTVVGWLILINVVIFLFDHFSGGVISALFRVRTGDLKHPLEWYRLLTYGFMHDPRRISHVAFNMLTLWFFGREIERLWGWKEFLRFYLISILVGGLTWTAIQNLVGADPRSPMLGASGAVTAVFVLFALKFPHQKVYLMFIPIPIPAWVLGVFFVGSDLLGALGAPLQGADANVAFSVHLAGAAFAAMYHTFGWNFARWTAWIPSTPRARRRPPLRLHRPSGDEEASEEDQLMERADEILAKISREGIQSLTRQERRLLEAASRRAQQRRTNQEVD